jgi:hypothetical protein
MTSSGIENAFVYKFGTLVLMLTLNSEQAYQLCAVKHTFSKFGIKDFH